MIKYWFSKETWLSWNICLFMSGFASTQGFVNVSIDKPWYEVSVDKPRCAVFDFPEVGSEMKCFRAEINRIMLMIWICFHHGAPQRFLNVSIDKLWCEVSFDKTLIWSDFPEVGSEMKCFRVEINGVILCINVMIRFNHEDFSNEKLWNEVLDDKHRYEVQVWFSWSW